MSRVAQAIAELGVVLICVCKQLGLTYQQANTHRCICARACLRASMCACVHMFVHMYVRVPAYVCVCLSMSAYVRLCLCAPCRSTGDE